MNENNKKIIPATKARKNFFKIIADVQNPGSFYTLTIDGKPEAVLMSFNEYESILETIDFLSEPGALADLQKAEEEVKAGKVFSWDSVKNELAFAQSGASVIADAGREKYQPKQRKKNAKKISN